MKMTRLEWRYLQRIALDHPYFDTHELPLTEKEAKAIVKENIKMTGKEFVDSIYAKLGMTRPKEEKKRFVWLRSISELFTVPPIRKIAIALLVVILMAIFFAATPTGRAIAESVIQYVVKLFDGKGVVVYQEGNTTEISIINYKNPIIDDALENKASFSPKSVDSFVLFAQATGKTPYILPIECISLFYQDEDELTLFSVYDTPKGRITACQKWGVEELAAYTSTGYKVLSCDDTVYFSIEEENGCISCLKILGDSIFVINSEGTITLDEMIALLKE